MKQGKVLVCGLWGQAARVVGAEEENMGVGMGMGMGVTLIQDCWPAQIPATGVWALRRARLTESKTISSEPGATQNKEGQGLSAFSQGRLPPRPSKSQVLGHWQCSILDLGIS